ncbi:dihydrolipoyllysine-residue acetyltransferase [Alteromonas sp. ASW11-36]|uniref:Dihydrolipoamide acetyltransferase component of pyruvate dehydrogenase complex n=1 Tax=Alteromonas arenosi TaxID=3055817 RepID=A0ABT7SZD3_9ALTE|nr:dihydrolipoyllysine-residue acetyltransferase [Alteromonas sp. ASW11-36]MDM7860894.1 dihydrolipoyllysine-residue acetyltransferase [Alteromonas sp. ASW11-36]
MSIDFILPDIGEGIVECELLEWLVKEGDRVVEDQPVAEVMTDKATVQIPAMYSGTVEKLYYQVGEIAKVHAPLFAMVKDGDTAAAPVSDEAAEVAKEPTATETPAASSGGVEDFILPDIGEGIVECEVIKWLVAEGEAVEEDQAVIEVMTDKAVVEIPAKHSGTIVKHYYKEGEIAKVHAPLFALQSEHSSGAAATSKPAVAAAPASATTVAAANHSEQGGEFEPPVAIPGRVLASPAVRRIARERNVDLVAVKGSGKKGRVLKQDVLAAASGATAGASQSPAPNIATQNAPELSASAPVASSREDVTVKVKGIQAAMAKQMTESVSTIPHFTVSDELEMSALIELRGQLKASLAEKGIKLSFMPFFIKALSMTLQQFPVLNSRLSADGSELTYLADHNIGLAVDSKIGLLVPNIKQVQDKSIEQIAVELNTLIDKAREGRLSNTDLTGGTISISNIGAIGGTTATPVINKPEVAIVALGKTQQLPRFDADGKVIAANIMTINWSGDHRVIDGATMVKFNNLFMSYLQNPATMLVSLR